MSNDYFQFKQFTVQQSLCAMKVGTDGTLLGAWAKGGERVLDIGTGTGLVALMMAQRFAKARVHAIDLERDAYGQAVLNVAESPFADRISVACCSLQDFSGMTPAGAFDAIVSNPPYFQNALKAPDAARQLARHTDSLPYADLMRCSYRLLSQVGEFSVIIPSECRKDLELEAAVSGFMPARVCAVRTKPARPPRRYLLAFRKTPASLEQTEMVIGLDAHREMMKDFYLE